MFIGFKVLKFYNAFKYNKKKIKKKILKLFEKASKICKSISNLFEKACGKTPLLQDSSVVNTTTSLQVIDQNNADN